MGGRHGTFGGSCYLHPTFGGHASASMVPSIAAANGGFRFRMSERPEGSEFGTGRSRRETQGTGPEAAPAAGGPAASPGSVSWLLLGAPRSNSRKPAQPAAKSLLIPDRCVVADLHRPTTGGETDMKVNGLPPHP